jgi:cytochrome c peroxidase
MNRIFQLSSLAIAAICMAMGCTAPLPGESPNDSPAVGVVKSDSGKSAQDLLSSTESAKGAEAAAMEAAVMESATPTSLGHLSPTAASVATGHAEQLLVAVDSQVAKASFSPPADHPEGLFWQVPDPSLIQDEPMEVKVQLGLPALTTGVNVPSANPITKGKFELGKQLYFDPRLSLDGTISCASCHDPDKGWTDRLATSVGIDAQVGGRNAPTVTNTAFGKTMFWDGRAGSLEAQAQGPVLNEIEMGAQTYDAIVKRLREIPGYREQFRKVFGTDVTLDGIAKAIATYERVAALSGGSKFDRYVGGVGQEPDPTALSESEKRGMVLFGLRLDQDDEFVPGVELQKAKCSACHFGPNFSDEQFHNLGVGYDESTGKFADLGRFAVTPIGSKEQRDIGAFKTPTVRDAEKSAPYMHDGSEKTLEQVVEYYNKGGKKNPYLDIDMKPLNLTDQEKADLVAFMKALTGVPAVPHSLPQLPAGPTGTSPDPSKALMTPIKGTAMRMTIGHRRS